MGDKMTREHGIRALPTQTLESLARAAFARGLDKTYDAINRELSRRDMATIEPPRAFNALNQSAHINPFAY